MDELLVIWYVLGPIVGLLGAVLSVRLACAVLGVPRGSGDERILKVEYPEMNTELERVVFLLWAFVSFLLIVSTWYLALPRLLGLL